MKIYLNVESTRSQFYLLANTLYLIIYFADILACSIQFDKTFLTGRWHVLARFVSYLIEYIFAGFLNKNIHTLVKESILHTIESK